MVKLKGLREFMVCRNCLLAHESGDGVECGYETIPGAVLPADWRCSKGMWTVEVNGNRNVVPVTTLAMDEDTPAYFIDMPEQEPEPKPAGIPDELKDKIAQFVRKNNEPG